MTSRIDKMIDDIIGVEGGYSDHPSDRGGPTRWGITEARARAEGYTGSMKELPRGLAEKIYRKRYISDPGFGNVYTMSPDIAAELVDTGVNMGPAVASVFFQRWLNALNRRGADYPDIFVDGRIGPLTMESFRRYLGARGRAAEAEKVLLTALNCSQGSRYLDIAEGRESQEDFLYGWVRARVSI